MAPGVTVVVVVVSHQNLGAHARFAQDRTKKDLHGVVLITGWYDVRKRKSSFHLVLRRYWIYPSLIYPLLLRFYSLV